MAKRVRKQAETAADFSAAQSAAPQLASASCAQKKSLTKHSWYIVDDATGNIFDVDHNPQREQLHAINAEFKAQQLLEDAQGEAEAARRAAFLAFGTVHR